MVVKNTEWWLGPTTPDQCGQNPATRVVMRTRILYCDSMVKMMSMSGLQMKPGFLIILVAEAPAVVVSEIFPCFSLCIL